MNLLMPLFAALLVASFDLHPAVSLSLVLLSISPVPPLLPIKGRKAGGGSEFIFSLMSTEAVLAIVLVPVSIEVFDRTFKKQAHVSPAAVALVVLMTVLAPLACGMLFRRFALTVAEKIAKPISLIATVLLTASLIPILFVAIPAIVSLLGNGTLAVFVAFIVAGLAAGHLLGGPAPQDRTVLAFSTASRHPGVAVAMANATFPEERLVLAAVLLYLMVSAVVSIPYVVWRRRVNSRHKSPELSDLSVFVKSRYH
jgi:BASS family bile acid:Na+ symporter